MVVNNLGNVFLTGYTNSLDFPTTNGAFDTSYNGNSNDGFICKLSNDGKNLVFSTYIGGSSIDHAFGVCLDQNENILIVGETSSRDFPYSENKSNFKSFLIYMDYKGSSINYSEFNDTSVPNGIISDNVNNFFIWGTTRNEFFPIKGGFFDTAYFKSEDMTNRTQYLLKMHFKNFDVVNENKYSETQLHLNNPYPNPSNSSFTISYNISKESKTKLEIFNISGQKVATIFSGIQIPGNYNFIWRVNKQASGIFFCKLKTDEFTETKKFILLK